MQKYFSRYSTFLAYNSLLVGISSLLVGPLALFLIIFLLSDLITDTYILCVSQCEGAQPSTLDNNYWKIENIKANTWHVLFRNVGVKYEIRQCISDADVKTSLFEFREIGPNYAGIYNDDFLLKMTQEEMFDFWAKNNQGFEYVKNGNGTLYLVGSADKKYVFLCENHNNIVDATMEHFNNIQRGLFHPDAENKINPNAHGRGTNVLANVKNTFGLHNKDVWPSDKDNHNNGHNSASVLPLSVISASASVSKANSVKMEYSQSESVKSDEPIKSTKSLSEQINKQTKQKADQNIKRDIRSPLDQFIMRDFLIIIIPLLASLQFSFTNMTLYLSISMLTIMAIYFLPLLWEKIKTSTWFITIVSILHTVYNLVKSQIQRIRGINFLPFFACLFLYILVNNLIGMIPYTFAPTAHFILTFFISFSLVIGCTLLGFKEHKLLYFSLLTPHGCPLGLLPLLVFIETISYLARNVSLGLRLAANILSGHMLLNILSEFTYKIMETDFFHFLIAIIPLMFIGGFSALELGIAFIQSQVFVVLSSSYTKDSIELH
jgi:F-type H+-transporting ATPase subunit a